MSKREHIHINELRCSSALGGRLIGFPHSARLHSACWNAVTLETLSILSKLVEIFKKVPKLLQDSD